MCLKDKMRIYRMFIDSLFLFFYWSNPGFLKKKCFPNKYCYLVLFLFLLHSNWLRATKNTHVHKGIYEHTYYTFTCFY